MSEILAGFDCDLYGQPGNGTTYRPPNEWGEVERRLRDQPLADHFGNVGVRFSRPRPPTGPRIDDELEYLMALKRQLRPSLLHAIFDEKDYIWKVFERTLGIEALPDDDKIETRSFMAAIDHVARFWAMKHKLEVNRPRPVQLLRDLDPPFCPGHPSYPSGHAFESTALALSLMDAITQMPRYHPLLIGAARQIAFHREVAGVHYPSDSECGMVLAGQLIDSLRSDPGYRAKVAMVRRELEPLLP